MLEVAVYTYFGAGTLVALVNAQGAKKTGMKSEHPTALAIVHTAVCLFLWPVVVGYVYRYAFHRKAR